MNTLNLTAPNLFDWPIYCRQLPAEAVQKVKESINAPENLKIIPTSIHEQVVIKLLFFSPQPLMKRCVLEMGGIWGGAIGGRVILWSVHHWVYICPQVMAKILNKIYPAT